ncbi:MAG: hypothetical protein MUC63_03045 [Planctomycetes bacterium]|jgi:hypothetical protein|nr:hypothetical protein [Planctomycetota bacterium]
MKTLFAAAWALALLGGAAAAEDGRVAFAPDFRDGEACRGSLRVRVDLVLSSGKEAEEPIPLTVGREEEWGFRVLSAADGRPSRAEKQVRRCAESRESPLLGGKSERAGFAAGKTFDLEAAEGGPKISVSAPEADRGAAIPAPVRAALEAEFGLAWAAAFPAGPVPRDHAWAREGKELAPLLRLLGVGPVSEGKAAFRIAEVAVKDGLLCATVEVGLSGVKMKGSEPGMEIALDGKGAITFVLDGGRISKAALKGEARLDDPATGLSGKGTFELSYEFGKTG